MIKAIVIGAAGRMGNKIIDVIDETEGIKLTGAVERDDHPAVGNLCERGLAGSRLKIADNLSKVISGGDVIIDFSTPASSLENLRMAKSEKKAIVIGTTGLSSTQIEEIKKLSEKIQTVISPNMSVGINVVFKVVADIAKILKDEYDVEIIEAHHRHKKDAPSGTAMKIAQIISQTLGRDLEKIATYHRRGIIGERGKKEIGIQTIRAGDITGEHTVIFGGIGESLEIVHRAHNRDNFARGAVKAAKWLVEQKSGLYDMQDVLGLKN